MKRLSLACATSVIALTSVPGAAQVAPPATDQTSDPSTTAGSPLAPTTPAIAAQDAGSPTADAAASPASQSGTTPTGASTPTGAEGIVVTGSRVVRNGAQAPTPVTVVTTSQLAQIAPSSIADALNQLPQFSASSNQNTGATFSATGAAKGNYLNLRGLGAQRTLTLLNGSRVVPTTTSNAVDVNVLPQLLVSRVDVVTGGASAVYGSDAVTGVVNFIIDDHFEGLKTLAQYGISSYGDDASYRLGVAGGFKIGDRIHIVGSYERYKSDGIGSINDRPWSHPDVALTGGGTAANPYVQTPMARTSVLTYGGNISTGILAGQRFLPNGTLTPFVNGQRTGSSATQIGGDGIVYTTSLAASLKTDEAYLRGTVDITDDIQFFAEGIYGRSYTAFDTQPSNNRPNSNRTLTIYSDNAYLRPEIAAQLAAAGQTSFQMGRFFRDIPSMRADNLTTYYSAHAGLKGKLGDSWGWDVNYVHGRSENRLRSNEFNSRNFFAAIDAVRDPASGQIVCRVSLTNPGFLPGCTPLNPLGEGNVSQGAIAFTRQLSISRNVNTMDYVNANVHGNLFELPAGPVTVAFGGEYRHQSLKQTSNADPASLSTAALRSAYFDGIRGVPASALRYLVTNVGQANGSQSIKEGYAEVSIPVFKDKRFAQALDVDLAGRVTNYRTSGTVETWKAGVTWTPVRGLRFRGAQSRDIAAPGLFDLFAGPNVRNLGVQDPLTNVLAVTQIINQGNSSLKPEKADTTTLGFVLQPQFFPGLTFSIDAYRIKVKGAIQTTSEINELNECQASGGTAPVCSLIIRPFPFSNTTAANFPTTIFVTPQNLAALKTRGIDFDLSYTHPLGGFFAPLGGRLSVRAVVNYLDQYDTNAGGTQPTLKRAGKTINGYASGGLPKWHGLLTQTYSQDAFDFTLTERFTGKYYLGVTEVFAPGFDTHFPNKTYLDANLNVNVGGKGKPQLFANVQNVLNTKPPVQQFGAAAGLNAPTDTTLYDIVGRYFTVGFRTRF